MVFAVMSRIMIIVQRPPAHFTERLLHAVSCDSRGHTFPTPPRVSHLSNTTGASATDGSTITAGNHVCLNLCATLYQV